MSRINIKPEDCKFVVNREKGKVVCIYEGCAHELSNMLNDMEINEYCFVCLESAHLPNKFIGIATCSADDEWNEELGKRIAFLRMRRKFYTSFFKAANNFINKIDDVLARTVEEFNNFGERVEHNINKESEWIKKQIHE